MWYHLHTFEEGKTMPTTRHDEYGYAYYDNAFHSDGKKIYLTVAKRRQDFESVEEAIAFVDQLLDQLCQIKTDEVFGS